MILFYLRVKLVAVISITQIKCPPSGKIQTKLLPSYMQTNVEKVNLQHVYQGDDSSLLFTANKSVFLKMPWTPFGIAVVFTKTHKQINFVLTKRLS